ncbi:MAG: hypothetical protein EBV03_00720 [Proteobacteria bacterium]|nr:hypothetical protein [Pseudomonadota bacterium]
MAKDVFQLASDDTVIMAERTNNSPLPPPDITLRDQLELQRNKPDIIPESIRNAANPPSSFVLVATEEEIILHNPRKPEDAAKVEAKRAALMEPLKNAGVPEEAIKSMSARELLAAELIYVDPETSKVLQKASGPFDVKNLYDAVGVLEFKTKADTSEKVAAGREKFLEVLKVRMAEYGVTGDVDPVTHVNVSLWEHADGKFTNTMDSKNPRSATKGAAMAKEVTDLVRASTKYVTGGNFGVATPGGDTRLGVSRENDIRQSGDGPDARIEVRLTDHGSASDRVRDLMRDAEAAGKRAAAVPETPVAGVSLMRRGFFGSGSEEKMKLTRHVLNGSYIATDGRVIPDRGYIEMNAKKIVYELGLSNVPPSEGSGFGFRPTFGWEADIVTQVMQNARIDTTDGTPKLVFPEIRINEKLPGVLSIPARHDEHGAQTGVRTVTAPDGKIVVEVSRSMMENFGGMADNAAGVEGVAKANRALSQLTVQSVGTAYAYTPSLGPAEAWKLSGSLTEPVIRIDMRKIPEAERANVALKVDQAAYAQKEKGYEIYLDGRKVETRGEISGNYLNGVELETPDAYRFRRNVAASGVVELRGDEAYRMLINKDVPPEAVSRFIPDAPGPSKPVPFEIPRAVFAPEFAATRARMKAVMNYARQQDSTSAGRAKALLSETVLNNGTFKNDLEVLKNDPVLREMGVTFTRQGKDVLVEMPTPIFEAVGGRIDTEVRKTQGISPALSKFFTDQRPGFSKAANITGIVGGINTALNKNELLPDSVRYLAATTLITTSSTGFAADVVAGRATARSNAAFLAKDLTGAEAAMRTASKAQTVARIGGGVSSAIMIPIDISQAYQSFQKNDIVGGSLSTANAASGTLILTSIVAGGTKVAAVAGPVGVGIAIVTTSIDIGLKAHEIHTLLKDTDSLKQSVIDSEKRMFQPGVTQEYVAYYDKNKELLATRPYRAPLPKLNEYKNLSFATTLLVEEKKFTAQENPNPKDLEKAIDAELKVLEAKKAELSKGFSDVDRTTVTSVTRDGRATTITTPSDRALVQTPEGRVELQSRNVFSTKNDDPILAVGAVDDRIRRLNAAKKELIGDAKGLVDGKEGLLSYQKRYDQLMEARKQYENVVRDVAPKMPAMQKTAEALESRNQAYRNRVNGLRDKFEKKIGKATDLAPFAEAKKAKKALDDVRAKDPDDKLVEALALQARITELELEGPNLAHVHGDIAKGVLQQANENADMANDPEFLAQRAALEAQVKDAELTALQQNAERQIKAYVDEKETMEAEKARFAERFGSEEAQQALLEKKDPAYMAARDKLAMREDALLEQYMDAVALQRDAVTRERELVKEAFLQQEYKNTEMPLKITGMELVDEVLRRDNPFRQMSQLQPLKVLNKEMERAEANRSVGLEFNATPDQAERFKKELTAQGITFRMEEIGGARLGGTKTFHIKMTKGSLDYLIAVQKPELQADGSVPISLPSGKPIVVEGADKY